MFFFLSQAVDDSGVPGMDRVDSMAEYLVELRHQLSLARTNQQVRNMLLYSCIIVLLLSLCALSYIFTLMFLSFLTGCCVLSLCPDGISS